MKILGGGGGGGGCMCRKLVHCCRVAFNSTCAIAGYTFVDRFAVPEAFLNHVSS